MHCVDLYLVIGLGECDRIPLGKSLDSIPDVVEVARDYINGPLQQRYPALYTFAEFGLQAIESFSIAVIGHLDYTATIGVADLSDVPILDRGLAAKLAGSFVTSLRISRSHYEEEALKLLDTAYGYEWTEASFTVEPGKWLTRHLLGEKALPIKSLKA
ncbi:MAG: hypothetical protein R2880_02700 [Deinococcales bacterium]